MKNPGVRAQIAKRGSGAARCIHIFPFRTATEVTKQGRFGFRSVIRLIVTRPGALLQE